MLAVAYRYLAVIGLAAMALVLGAACGAGDVVILATTTSTFDTGLLDALVPAFEDQTDYSVKVIAVGTGQALEMGRRGDADALLVHAPEAEEEFVAEGFGVNWQLVMHNDFIFVGPEDDPAGVAEAQDVLGALQAIVNSGSSFISRGDDSGTHQLELSLWEELGFDPTSEGWYDEAGQGMAATLQIANQRDAYTISDRATYLVQQENLDLVIQLEGDPRFLNIYHVMQVNPERFGSLNESGAQAFVEFMVSDGAQALIGDFGVDRFGRQLFVPDAGKTIAEIEESAAMP